MCTEETLDDIFNRLQDITEDKNCYYYPVCKSQEKELITTAYDFIKKYFLQGGKKTIFDEIESGLSEKAKMILIMRSEHMRSVFLIGIDIYDNICRYSPH